MPSVRPADCRDGGVHVDEGVVEQAEHELLPEQAAHRHVEALLRDPALSQQRDDQLGSRLTAELVAAGYTPLEADTLVQEVIERMAKT